MGSDGHPLPVIYPAPLTMIYRGGFREPAHYFKSTNAYEPSSVMPIIEVGGPDRHVARAQIKGYRVVFTPVTCYCRQSSKAKLSMPASCDEYHHASPVLAP